MPIRFGVILSSPDLIEEYKNDYNTKPKPITSIFNSINSE